jgi:RNA polymerase sigma factor (sigma-70 family)
MPEAENHVLPGATQDSWRTWLMTGARRAPADRRRMRGAHKGLKRMLVEGMRNGDDRPHAWKDFSGAMIRHAVDEAIRSLPQQETRVVKLAYFGGYSNREIADEVGLTEATVQRRLRRALSTISEHIQRGRTLGRRAMYAALLWLAGRSASDLTHHAVQAVAVASVAVIVATRPAPLTVAAPHAYDTAPPATHAGPVVPPLPSPTALAKQLVPIRPVVPVVPQAQQPPAQLPVPLPPLPTPLPSLPSVPIPKV